MRTTFTAVVLAAGLGGLTAAEPVLCESKEGKFSAKFPGKVTVDSKTAGGLTLNLFNSEVDKGKGGYLITYSDLPAELLKAPQPDQVLASSEKGVVETFKAKVTKSDKLEFGAKKYPGRMITAERGEWNMRAKLILVGNRLYQVCVYGTKEFVATPEADAFLGSFALKE
jgi:hypothetical protein